MKRASEKLDPALVRSVRVEHTAYGTILQRLREAFDDAPTSATPTCLHIIGETRTGKSAVVRDFLGEVARRPTSDANQQSVLYAIAPAEATVKNLLESLLKGLGDPFWSAGTKSSMLGRLHTQLQGVNCQLIILDEFQHLCDKGQKQRLKVLSDFLKNLIEDKPWGLVALGLPSSLSVINANSQLAGRFDPPLSMPMFDWHQTSSRTQFRGFLAAFQKQLKPFELPELAKDPVAFRMYLASTGRAGLVAKLLDRAIRNAVRAGTNKIRLTDLQKAFDESIWFAPKFPLVGGPFGADLSVTPSRELIDSLLKTAEQELYEDNTGAVSVVSPGTGDAPPTPTKRQHKADMAAAL